MLLSVSAGKGGFLRRPTPRRACRRRRRGRPVRLLVAGGGTGGHVFRGIAMAEEVVGRHPKNDVVFVGTARGLEAAVVPAAGFPIELIEVRGLKGKGILGVLAGLLLLPRAFLRSWSILRAGGRRGGGSGRLRQRPGGSWPPG